MAIRTMLLGFLFIACTVGSIWVSRMLNGSSEEVLAGLVAIVVAVPIAAWIFGKVVE